MLLWQQAGRCKTSRPQLPWATQPRQGAAIHPSHPKIHSPAYAPQSGWLSHHIMSLGPWLRMTETAQSKWCKADCIWHPGKTSVHVFASQSPLCLITGTPDQQNAASRLAATIPWISSPCRKVFFLSLSARWDVALHPAPKQEAKPHFRRS